MFQTLTQNLTDVFNKLRGYGALTEEHIDTAMREVRIALIEADVSLEVVKAFIKLVSERAKGQEVVKSVSPGQMVVKIFNDELVKLLSSPEEEQALNLKSTPPANILMIGLQGSGKTSSAAKLALRLKKEGKEVLLVSLDTYRPAAQKQLKVLADSEEIDSLDIVDGQNPIDITKRAMSLAKLSGYDVVIYDSAGRLQIDETMIKEVQDVKALIKPTEVLFVADAMIGQESVNVAKSFDEALSITGNILTRIDGDARGGAALSIKYVVGKPIKFIGIGEKIGDFDVFKPKSIASRILGMGDIVSLVEEASENFSQEEAEKTLKKMKKGQFTLEDFLSQLEAVSKMGGMGKIMNMMPGMSGMMKKIDPSKMDDKIILHQKAIITSMTKKERNKPALLNASRKKRIASGSGRSVQEVNRVLKQHLQMQTMMKKMSKMNPKNMMRAGLDKLGGMF